MELRYRHIKEDLENGTIPLAIRLEPCFYVGKKAAGYTFLGAGSILLLRDCIEDGIVEARPDAKLIPKSYYCIWAAIHRVSRRIGLDTKIQTCHGFRKYFENALDDANIDHEKKMVIEGHFAGTRARHYTDRDLEELRGLYKKAYSFIVLNPESISRDNFNPSDWKNRLVGIESKLARQNVLETRLVAVEDELKRLSDLHRR